ncbi:MAG: serine hydrolase domain-containing protein [Bacteroidota bacterium]
MYLFRIIIITLILHVGYSFPQVLKAQSPYFSFQGEGVTVPLTTKMEAAKVHGMSYYIMHENLPDTSFQIGYRDLENQLAVESSTQFQVGSMTAPLLHFAVLRAVDEGLVDLDARANDYLQRWQISWNPLATFRPVKVRDLLQQNCKFNLGSKPRGYVPGSEIPSLVQILNGEAPSQEKPVRLISPYNLRGYSSFANVMILQLLLEDVYQEDLASIIQRQVLTPLEMNHSTFTAELSPDYQKTAAVGYDKQGERIEGDRWIHPELGAVGLWSTPKDYSKFVWYVIQASQGKDNRFLSQEMALAGITPNKQNRGLIFYNNDGLYWGGASMGFRTQFSANLDEGWVAVCFMNSHENWRFMAQALGAAERYAQAKARSNSSTK